MTFEAARITKTSQQQQQINKKIIRFKFESRELGYSTHEHALRAHFVPSDTTNFVFPQKNKTKRNTPSCALSNYRERATETYLNLNGIFKYSCVYSLACWQPTEALSRLLQCLYAAAASRIATKKPNVWAIYYMTPMSMCAHKYLIQSLMSFDWELVIKVSFLAAENVQIFDENRASYKHICKHTCLCNNSIPFD